jgi:SNF2 family DNA or RNA helicase
MFAVHGLWHVDVLCVWAEDSELPAATRSRAKVRPHPYAVASDRLATVLWDLGPEVADLAAKAAEGELVLRLPGSATAPVSSPELGRTVTRRRLAGWRVPVLRFAPAAALELLGCLDGTDEVLVGADLGFLSVVAADAVQVVRRGRVLPMLVSEEGAYAARWRPVLAGADARRFRELAAAMPPVCRAAGDGRSSAHVLLEALVTLTDAAARRPLSLSPQAPRQGRGTVRSSFTDRWMAALTGHDARVGAAGAAQPRVPDADAARELSDALQAWFVAAHQGEADLRVCFRLAEPPAGDDRWRVGFAVQAVDDPSLRIEAGEIWAGETLPGHRERLDDVLLAGLGRAARLYPELNAALKRARPQELVLDTARAHAFLKETAPLLGAAGFGVLLPAWAGASRLGLKLTTRSATPSNGAATPGAFGLDQMVSFRWDLAVGDETINADELAELARLKLPLVRVRGQWVELDDRQLGAALKFIESRSRAGEMTGEMTAAEVVGEIVHGSVEGLPLVDVDADGRLGDLLSGQADRRLDPLTTPDGFAGTLRPYQERGLSWLGFLGELGLGAVLADDMGLGKSPQTLALLAHERSPSGQTGERAKPTLLVCPMSLVGNWQREAARFTPSLRVYVHHGGDRLRGEELEQAAGDADLVITTYATALRDQEALAAIEWGRVVCDEAQAIKNSASRQARAVRSIGAPSRVALTGTPVENHLGDLWSIMEFTNPGLLGSRAEFDRRYAVPIERDADPAATAALKRATQPFVLRRLKTDKEIISDLPDKLEMKVYCNLTPEQASLYQATVDDMLTRIADSDGIGRKGLVLATMTKLKQVCNHPAHLLKDGSRLAGRSGKLARLEEILSELLEEGDKALVFSQYTEFGSLLHPYLAARLGRPVLWLHGGTTKKERDALVERFQSGSEPMVFLLSLKAAGTGLNLTGANHVVHVDRWWNPAVENQATDRAFRIGQTKDVQVRKFVCVGTVEERVDEMIERKSALAERIVGTGEDWLTELSVADLRRLVELSPEAVSQ